MWNASIPRTAYPENASNSNACQYLSLHTHSVGMNQTTINQTSQCCQQSLKPKFSAQADALIKICTSKLLMSTPSLPPPSVAHFYKINMFHLQDAKPFKYLRGTINKWKRKWKQTTFKLVYYDNHDHGFKTNNEYFSLTIVTWADGGL